MKKHFYTLLWCENSKMYQSFAIEARHISKFRELIVPGESRP